jgi:hypothetical protein
MFSTIWAAQILGLGNIFAMDKVVIHVIQMTLDIQLWLQLSIDLFS